MRSKRFPNYPDDADYTTNAPSYYDDLARKQKLIRLLAERIWGYEKILDETLEQIQERFRAWDKNLEDLPEDVKVLLQQWLDNGTLDHIINETIFNWKLDTTIFEQFRDHLFYINPKSFGALGDGVTDDTVALEESINALENGGIFVLPEGTYRISKFDVSAKSNCTFNFVGKLKMIDGIETPYGLVSVGGYGNQFNNLTIDGNLNNAIDGGIKGVTSSLLLKNQPEKITFNNLTIENSMYSACVFNGRAKDIFFRGGSIDNTGEHCFYVSGGANKNIHFEDFVVTNIGLKSTEASFFVKSRGDTYGKNAEFYFKRIKMTQTIPITQLVMFLAFHYADNFYAEDIELDDAIHYSIVGQNSTKMRIKRLTLNNAAIVYNLDSLSKDVDIKVYDSDLKLRTSKFNLVREYKNCVMEVVLEWRTNTTAAHTYKDVLIDNCDIKSDGYVVKFDHINGHIIIKNSTFEAINATLVQSNFLHFGGIEVGTEKHVSLEKSTFKIVNKFSNAASFTGGVNLKIEDVFLDTKLTGTVGTLKVRDLYTDNLPTSLNAQSNLKYTTAFFENVDYNGISTTKRVFVLTIPSGSTSSNTETTTYSFFRNISLQDVTVSQMGNTNGITEFYPNLTESGILSVKSLQAPSSPVSFKVKVEVSS